MLLTKGKNRKNGAGAFMEDLSVQRTPPMIAAEINMIKYQAERFCLFSSIEIGRRLKEAKKMIQHGDWLKWLEETVTYSEKTAQNLMRIYEVYGESYGTQPPALPGAVAQIQRENQLPSLNYTQALILLGVPDEEREQFLEVMDVESMSARELKKAVNDRNRANQERDQVLREKADLQQALDKKEGELVGLEAERDKLKTETAAAIKAKKESDTKTDTLKKEVENLQQNSNVKRVERMGRKLDETYYKNRANRIVYLLEDMRRCFKDLVFEMKEFHETEPNGHEIYRLKVVDFLSKALTEKLTKEPGNA